MEKSKRSAIISPYMETKFIEKYFFLAILFITFIFCFFIFRPFWIVLVLGASLSVVIYPVYKLFKKIKLPNWLASLLTVFLLTILILGPLFGIGVLVFKQSQNIYHLVLNGGNIGSSLNLFENKINQILPTSMALDTNGVISNSVSFISNNIAKIFSTTFSTFLSFILILLTVFYLLKDGEDWKKKIILLSPLSEANDEKILTKLSKTINGVLKGYILIALIQGILMWAGLSLFGVPNGAFWGLVGAVATLIPPLGTGVVAIPAVIFLYATGHTLNAIGLLAWSVLIVGLIDNFLNPYIVGKNINIPPFLILFSVLGGIALLGPIGILIGPIAVSMLHTLISIYKNDFK